VRTLIIYHKDGTKTVLSGDAPARPRESYESLTGEGKNFHEHFIECNKRAEAAGELSKMSHRERQYIKDVHTYAQQPGWWPKEPPQ
jgi:hypothetical protein